MTATGELSTDQRVALLESRVLELERIVGGKLEGGGVVARVLFASPTTGQISATPQVYGVGWFDATGYATLYGNPQAYHTGADLNLGNYADSGKPVFASADGEIVFAGVVKGWQGQVVVIKHQLEDASWIWTRYAHITDVVPIGMIRVFVKRGDKLGVIADYNKDGPKGDHLHFDVARIDLGVWPGDWPGLDKVRVLRDYIDPAQWLRDRSK